MKNLKRWACLPLCLSMAAWARGAESALPSGLPSMQSVRERVSLPSPERIKFELSVRCPEDGFPDVREPALGISLGGMALPGRGYRFTGRIKGRRVELSARRAVELEYDERLEVYHLEEGGRRAKLEARSRGRHEYLLSGDAPGGAVSITFDPEPMASALEFSVHGARLSLRGKTRTLGPRATVSGDFDAANFDEERLALAGVGLCLLRLDPPKRLRMP